MSVIPFKTKFFILTCTNPCEVETPSFKTSLQCIARIERLTPHSWLFLTGLTECMLNEIFDSEKTGCIIEPADTKQIEMAAIRLIGQRFQTVYVAN